MKLNIKKLQKQWFDYEEGDEGAKLCIRPFPLSNFSTSDDMMNNLWEQFDYCLTDWKGFVDDDNKEIKCSKHNKRMVFDFYDGLREFVFEKAREIAGRADAELKN